MSDSLIPDPPQWSTVAGVPASFISSRTHRTGGTPYDAGFKTGRELGRRLEANIARYLGTRELGQGVLDSAKLASDSVRYVDSLPARFRDELAGQAAGSGVPLHRIAEMAFVEECIRPACTGFVVEVNGEIWVGRNNDTYVPEMFGYATVKSISGRIPHVGFSLEGDQRLPTAYNQAGLWLHYNYEGAPDRPRTGRPQLPNYLLITEMAETCRSLSDVERVLGEFDRFDGMLLFAVDGPRGEYAIYECTCTQFFKREMTTPWVCAANHYCTPGASSLVGQPEERSLMRQRRAEERVASLGAGGHPISLPDDLISILADPGVEQQRLNFATAYSCVARPATGDIWFTFGGYPAASRGNWAKIPALWE